MLPSISQQKIWKILDLAKRKDFSKASDIFIDIYSAHGLKILEEVMKIADTTLSDKERSQTLYTLLISLHNNTIYARHAHSM